MEYTIEHETHSCNIEPSTLQTTQNKPYRALVFYKHTENTVKKATF